MPAGMTNRGIPSWFVASGSDTEHWTAEAAIPWSELTSTPPAIGDAWAVGRARSRRASHETHGKTLDPRDFGMLLFK